MWQQQPDHARYKEKLKGEGWLVNSQEGMLLQIKPDAPTQHAQFLLVSYYRLSARLGQPISMLGFQYKFGHNKTKARS